MENIIEIPNAEGTIFKLGDEIFIANGGKHYSTFGSEEEFSRKDLKKIVKDEGCEVVILVGNTNPDFTTVEGRTVEKDFFISLNTPFRWSSGEYLTTLGENHREFGSLEEARDEALRREVVSYGENCVTVGYGVRYKIRQDRSNINP